MELLNDPISIINIYNHKTNKNKPAKILWKNKVYKIDKIGMHHTFKTGDTLFHVFSVTSKNLFFKIIFNSENLSWKLKQMYEQH